MSHGDVVGMFQMTPNNDFLATSQNDFLATSQNDVNATSWRRRYAYWDIRKQVVSTASSTSKVSITTQTILQTSNKSTTTQSMFPFHEMFDINIWETGVYYACHPQYFIARPPNLQFKPCCDCQQDCKKYGTCCIDSVSYTHLTLPTILLV